MHSYPLVNLPIDIYNIIWIYLWPSWGKNLKGREPPVTDLYRVADIQDSVPSCLLSARVPTISFSGDYSQHAIMYQFFPLSPYKRGNPYRPLALTHTQYFCWSRLPTALLNILAKHGPRKMRTYRAHLERKSIYHYNRSILKWNRSYVQLFQFFAVLSDEDFVLMKDPYLSMYRVTLYLKELAAARFLTTAIP